MLPCARKPNGGQLRRSTSTRTSRWRCGLESPFRPTSSGAAAAAGATARRTALTTPAKVACRKARDAAAKRGAASGAPVCSGPRAVKDVGPSAAASSASIHVNIPGCWKASRQMFGLWRLWIGEQSHLCRSTGIDAGVGPNISLKVRNLWTLKFYSNTDMIKPALGVNGGSRPRPGQCSAVLETRAAMKAAAASCTPSAPSACITSRSSEIKFDMILFGSVAKSLLLV